MTDLELFKIEARKIGVDISEVETPMGIQFTYGNTRDIFKLWCASANREGYKLVPVKATYEMTVAASNHAIKTEPVLNFGDLYRAMIGATP